MSKKRTREDLEALLLSSRRITERGCWEFTGNRKAHKFNYGFQRFAGRAHHVHRLAAFLWKGLSLSDSETHVLHRCDNPPCFNPDHLFFGDNAANAADRDAKGRGNPPKGEEHGRSKLDAEAVEEMRRLHREMAITGKDLGRIFGVTQAMAARLLKGTAWRNPR